jgi:Catalase
MVTLGTLSSGSRTTVLLCTFKFMFALIRVSRYVIGAFGAHLKTRVLMITDIYIPQTLDDATAGRLAGENPDYGIEKLFNAIEAKNYPTWTVYIVSIHVINSREE